MNLLLGWLAIAPALAADAYLECRSFVERSDAVSASRAARDAGLDARVLRRFESKGWQYLVVVDSVADPQQAALDLASAVKCTSVQAFTAEGESLELFGALTGEEVPEVSQAAEPETVEEEPEPDADVTPWLEAMWNAHGGKEGGSERLAAASSLRFEFRRTLPNGNVVDHIWARRDKDWVVQIEPKKGDLQASQLLVKPQGAWASINGEPYASRDLERTREIAAALSPEKVVPFVLTFAGMLADRTALMDLELGDEIDLDGTPAQRLRYDGDRASESLSIDVDAKTGQVLRVDFGDGARVYRFAGWPSVLEAKSEISLPSSIQSWRGGELTDTVEALSLDLDPTLPQEWFIVPAE